MCLHFMHLLLSATLMAKVTLTHIPPHHQQMPLHAKKGQQVDIVHIVTSYQDICYISKGTALPPKTC